MMNSMGEFVLIFGFILFATIFGGRKGEKDPAEMEKVVRINGTFLAAAISSFSIIFWIFIFSWLIKVIFF